MESNAMNLVALNQASADEFVQTLGAIFEHSPWVARGALDRRPFFDIEQLHQVMCDVVRHASIDVQLGLLRAHPELAGKAAIRGELSSESSREQSGAGLDQCSADEYTELTSLNDRYHQKFGFPFIIAVRGHSRSSIIANLHERIEYTTMVELAQCLTQIERIARFRLFDAISE
jgi:2-oxo-4-hydroxy-4-carboxy-5-ureidoimidazoline decarboxylase